MSWDLRGDSGLLGAETDLVWHGAAERPRFPVRKPFALAAQLGPGAKTQSIPLKPCACCGGIPSAGEMQGRLLHHHVPPPNAMF